MTAIACCAFPFVLYNSDTGVDIERAIGGKWKELFEEVGSAQSLQPYVLTLFLLNGWSDVSCSAR